MAKTKQQRPARQRKSGDTTGSSPILLDAVDVPVASPAARTITWTIAAYVVLRLAATLFSNGTHRLWGIDPGSYLRSSWDVIAMLVLPALLLIPHVRHWIAHFIARDPAGGKLLRRSMLTIITIAATCAVWTWQVAYAFLGDGTYYATEILRIAGDPAYHTILIKPTSWLTGHLIHWLTITWEPESVRWPFQVTGATGMLLLTAGLLLMTLRARITETLVLSTAMVLGSATLMFFGYIELYALEFAFAALYLIASYRAFQSHISVIVPGALLAVAVACGASAIMYAPSYLILLHWKAHGEHGIFPPVRATIVLCIMPVIMITALYAYIGMGTYSPYLLSILPATLVENGMSKGMQLYTVFSSEHLADIVNVLALNGGVFVAVLPVAILVLWRTIRWKAPDMLFALAVLSSSLTFVLTGNATLGLARDWDVMTVPVAGMVFAAAAILLHARTSHILSLTLVLPLLVLTSLGDTYVWLRVNLDGNASASRLEHALMRDAGKVLPINTYTGLENLRKYYHSNRDSTRMLSVMHRMTGTGVQKIDTYTKELTAISEMKDAQTRRREYTWMFTSLHDDIVHPGSADTRSSIDPVILREMISRSLLFSLQTEDDTIARAWVVKFKGIIPQWKEAPMIEGFLDPGITLSQLAAKTRESVDNRTQDPSLLIVAARLHNQAQEWERAAQYYELSLQRDPKSQPIYYIELAQLYQEKLQRADAAMATLHRCITEAPFSAESAQARDALTRFEQQRELPAR